MPNTIQTVAVIGAGLSGTVVTAHLLMKGTGRPMRIVLVNRSGPFGALCGVWYYVVVARTERARPAHECIRERRRRLSPFCRTARSLDRTGHVRSATIVFGRNGRKTGLVYVTGPLLRARRWEATAVRELSAHAARVAGVLLGQLSAQRQQRSIA